MTTLSQGSLHSLQNRISGRLDQLLGHALSAGLRATIARELSEETGRWLKERAALEVIDSPGEYSLKRAADEAWDA